MIVGYSMVVRAMNQVETALKECWKEKRSLSMYDAVNVWQSTR